MGEVVRVEADAFAEGHDQIAVALKWRAADEHVWRERRMSPLGNDRWAADLPLERLGRLYFTVETWRDEFAMFHHELFKKHEVGLPVPLELEEGRRLVERTLAQAPAETGARLRPILERLGQAGEAERLALLLSPETEAAMAAADPRPFRLQHEPIPIDAERTGAGFASWYELFPRSQSGDPHRHGTFADVIGDCRRSTRWVSTCSIFPRSTRSVGRTGKAATTALRLAPTIPAAPMRSAPPREVTTRSIPNSGRSTICTGSSPRRRSMGWNSRSISPSRLRPTTPGSRTIRIGSTGAPTARSVTPRTRRRNTRTSSNVDFYAEGAKPSLWITLRDTIKLWVEHGIKLFRVDNPHTKPFPFWEWVIEDVRREHPDVVFLSEAFTKPKVMYRLAKIGFSQSYTYFTWRNTKWELQEYLTELSTQAPKEFFRPHFFVNTHDINPDFLQDAPRPAFLIRAALATMLSGLWGMYNGFELCEGRPDQKKKEYADSEKYQLYVWDWDRPGNIIREITASTAFRRDNLALQTHLGITFRQAFNDNVLLFEKATPARDNVLLIAVSLDPYSGPGGGHRSAALGMGLAGPRHDRRAGPDGRSPFHLDRQETAHPPRPRSASLLGLAPQTRKRIFHMARKPNVQLIDDPLWYKDAVIYQLHVKSFFDANNDGIGDFAGLHAKLDYIASLGVNTVWLFAVLSVSAQGRRLRHRRVPGCQQGLWNTGRVQGIRCAQRTTAASGSSPNS